MIRHTLSLRRRTRAERKALAILRGENICVIDAEQEASFLRLRQIAPAYGVLIQPAGTPYIAESEIRLLSWIAAAQRVEGANMIPMDHVFTAIIRRCAETLKVLHLRLPPLTLYSGRLRQHSTD